MRGLSFSDVHMEVSNGVFSELLLGRLVTCDFGQAADAVALQTSVEAGASQIWDGRLQSVKAVVEREQRPLMEGDDDDLLLHGKHSRVRLTRPIGASSTEVRLRHLATVLALRL